MLIFDPFENVTAGRILRGFRPKSLDIPDFP